MTEDRRAEIKLRADLPEIAGRYVSLQRYGRAHLADCPRCGAILGLAIEGERGQWRCLECHKDRGDVFGLLSHLGETDPEAKAAELVPA